MKKLIQPLTIWRFTGIVYHGNSSFIIRGKNYMVIDIWTDLDNKEYVDVLSESDNGVYNFPIEQFDSATLIG